MSVERRWLSAHIITETADEDVITNVRDSLSNFVTECAKEGFSVDWDSLYFRTESPLIVTDAAGNEQAYASPLILSVEAVKSA